MMRKQWFAAIALAIAAGCQTGGAPAVRMAASTDVPAARGTVTARATDDGNTAVSVEVRHLAAPERVQPGAVTYVVWARVPGQDTFHNLGALTVDAELRGSLSTVTPLRAFDVIITAESSPTATTPSNRRVLTASVQQK